MLLIVDGGQFVRFVVNVICEDFVWFILIFHLSNHSCRRSRCWSFCDANAGSLWTLSSIRKGSMTHPATLQASPSHILREGIAISAVLTLCDY
jgi:hypothetical protein